MGDKSPESEPPKPPKPILSVLTVLTLAGVDKAPEQDHVPPHDPAEWRKPFVQWLDSTCVRDPRAFGGVAALHSSFCDWEIARDEVPCNRQTFEGMLAELGFLMGKVRGTLLVSGLTFEDDLEDAGLL